MEMEQPHLACIFSRFIINATADIMLRFRVDYVNFGSNGQVRIILVAVKFRNFQNEKRALEIRKKRDGINQTRIRFGFRKFARERVGMTR